ncbi:hypothetical protein NKK48_29005 [Mesorhizobium sp. C386A]|uniref:hypothetical protein n=1 Tax=unclassified Mesorhizobium TaxID=325217 RepID=UPI0003CE4D0C|nr:MULTISPECIES: hypothetical protein [unclassified Mesorhizobium]ESY09170.1 hypothetical protein X752_21210 [Mesorhizobium sp. LNJC398B00]ESY32080.1 hypothetical protein X748_24230 [Mesorhizobium sp. LNJC386A00]
MWRSRVIVGVVIAIALQGCSNTDRQYFDSGIGTELGYSNLPNQTASQNSYIRYICEQAGSANCSAVDWNTFVQAGMNDIDERCDGYLAWLDARRRSNGAVLDQISDTQTAAEAVLIATKAGSLAISLVGTALGFARETFNNVNSRLLMEVNHSTVQSIVLSSQTRFREDLRTKSIGTRPQAVYALRQYLRICMPFTIETEINNTLTTYAQGGAEALDDRNRSPLVDTAIIGAPMTSGGKVEPRKYGDVRPDKNDQYAIILANPAVTYSEPYIRGVLGKLCVPKKEQAKPTKKTAARIIAYQQRLKFTTADASMKLTGKLTERELTVANGYDPCDSGKYANVYEKDAYPAGVTDVIALINRALPEGNRLLAGADQKAVRDKIPLARKAVEKSLTLTDPELSDQLTTDFMLALSKLPPLPGEE